MNYIYACSCKFCLQCNSTFAQIGVIEENYHVVASSFLRRLIISVEIGLMCKRMNSVQMFCFCFFTSVLYHTFQLVEHYTISVIPKHMVEQKLSFYANVYFLHVLTGK